MAIDWVKWHAGYDDDQHRQDRLAVVQGFLRRALDGSAGGPLRILSLCAGDGRDVIPVLRDRADAASVRATLVELDPTLAQRARETAAAGSVSGLRVLERDAGLTTSLAGAVPARILLVCGVFGNISDHDIEHTIRTLPTLAAPAAFVIWTRHRRSPDVTPRVRRWFALSGFDEIAFQPIPGGPASVGMARMVTEPAPFRPGIRLFSFDRRP